MSAYVKRIFSYFMLSALFVLPVLLSVLNLNRILSILLCLLLAVFFITYNIFPAMFQPKHEQHRLNILRGGYECMLASFVCFLCVVVVSIMAFTGFFGTLSGITLIMNLAVGIALLLILLINGIIRIFLTSSQTGITAKILLIFCWWVPIINIILLRKICITAGAEYSFRTHRISLNKSRKNEQVCNTRFPILLVHGVFFRDWSAFNYWGRIPRELEQNGAVLHYGNHQSSKSVEESGQEIADCIKRIVKETGCGKVNIIAHSKGGLDCRYAISQLGIGQYTASLTTINTPHFGCNYARRLMEIVPEKTIAAIGNKYDALYSKLGDEAPDFLSGLSSLTDTECARLNLLMPDEPGVLYQSVGSVMSSPLSAIFPLNVGYGIIKPIEGDNDGLVSVKSMKWGKFLGVVSPKGKYGISHADMIDLLRKDVEGFDVCEFYIDLVNGLKEMGL